MAKLELSRELSLTPEEAWAHASDLAHLGDWLGILPTGNHVTATGITLFRIVLGKVVEGWTSIDLNPTEEELQWSTQGGRGARSGEISLSERDASPSIWDVLTRNLTWRLRVAEVKEVGGGCGSR